MVASELKVISRFDHSVSVIIICLIIVKCVQSVLSEFSSADVLHKMITAHFSTSEVILFGHVELKKAKVSISFKITASDALSIAVADLYDDKAWHEIMSSDSLAKRTGSVRISKGFNTSGKSLNFLLILFMF